MDVASLAQQQSPDARLDAAQSRQVVATQAAAQPLVLATTASQPASVIPTVPAYQLPTLSARFFIIKSFNHLNLGASIENVCL